MTSSSHNIGPFGPRSINPRTKIAVIGAGIAGHGAAWALSKQCNVTLFERETQFGGHSYTYDVKCDGYTVPVDMGFIVYNELNYPNLVGLFNTLGVKTERSNMSFSVSLNNGAYEYHGSGLKGVFAQKRNLLHPGHLRMLLQVLKFYKSAPVEARARDLTQITLGEWLSELGMGRGFRERHIVPMAACIWSASAQEILDFPAAAFVRFFENHGLFKLKQRPQWRTVSGGSRSYVKALHDDMQAVTRRACPVSAVERGADSVTVHSPNGAEMFDEVIIATHGDEALPLIENPTRAETETLSAFRYSSNEVILHTDHRLMPKRRKVWSSWNYVAPSVIDPGRPVPLTYWMNRLQNLPANQDIFVTLNPLEPIAPKYVQQRRTFMHPIFDARTYAAQPKLQDLQGADRIWFAGSYFGYGFHEDALSSGLAVAKALGARLPWEEGAQAVAAE
ncbi:MAG: FAD-dependent oxidoreductase [Pseudomonadota bacterium]